MADTTRNIWDGRNSAWNGLDTVYRQPESGPLLLDAEVERFYGRLRARQYWFDRIADGEQPSKVYHEAQWMHAYGTPGQPFYVAFHKELVCLYQGELPENYERVNENHGNTTG